MGIMLLIGVILSLWVSCAHGQEKHCDFPEIKHGQLFNKERVRKYFPAHIGKSFYYHCNENYQPPSQVYWAEITCTKDGWFPEVPCRRRCLLDYLENGHILHENKIFVQDDTVKVACSSGYSLQNGQSILTCTEKGWSPLAKCINIMKPCDFPEIKHGHLYNSERFTPNFPVPIGKIFYYSCDENFEAPSQRHWAHISCTKEGWFPEVPCRRKCTFNSLENGQAPVSKRIYLEGDTVKVDCNAGHSLQNGQSVMACTEHGWSPPPRCIHVKTCSKSDIEIENGFFSQSAHTYILNRKTLYRCKPGYVTEHGRTIGSITCLENGWSDKPVCTKLCGLPVFRNSFSNSTKKRFKLNDTLNYKCLEGYENRDGNTTGSIICGEVGWNHLPTCYNSKEKCGPPPAIDNGDITSFLLKVYPPESKLEYQCQAYYMLQGSKYIVCDYGQWSKPPKCIDPCIVDEESMNKNNIQLRWKNDSKIYVKTGDIIQFICKTGYREHSPQQSFQTVCQEGVVRYPKCE
ncbi:complement factor H-related protein 3-like isoform X2 [Erinaceus europaeus]|uniref:Complement factor H-related protein 3-like isoform X2 n=1 Tax=Erinaceus europaeus TaxID=9365 RepID=A0ABM3WD27_ERIEU|nr:complement factor H-related protein 3-like isoform X2 [Erinaceus europaeus]